MLTSGLVFCAMASLLVGYMTTAMRPPRASPSRKIHGASRDHYASVEALVQRAVTWTRSSPLRTFSLFAAFLRRQQWRPVHKVKESCREEQQTWLLAVRSLRAAGRRVRGAGTSG